ncbi:TAXI family TRAP transporter solute-binding subunit [Nakamurella lactea]|uniref:TAXI family TRAP transporter solute-binding subunit n=1 Tax=Nakamurella lactea TaxID=459515 RepID=UPI0004236403|nr:TAXI family TRAP transporter solute-binding subunit [Nakamurella lactea]
MRRSTPGEGLSRRTLLAGAGALLLAGCGPSPRSSRPIVLATGDTKGVYYSYGIEVANALAFELGGVTIEVRSTSGSVDNLQRIARGTADLAIVAADAALDAASGRANFPAPVSFDGVARLYDDFIHLVVPADSPIRSVTDLPGHRLSLGSPGSGTELIAGRILETAAVSIDPADNLHLGINECILAMSQGRLEAFFWSGGLPTVGVTELAATTPIRLIDIGGLSAGMRTLAGLSYRSATVPARTYGIPEEITTIAVPNYLVVARNMSEDLVFGFTEGLFRHRDEMAQRVSAIGKLDIGRAIYTAPIELHPGALRYYRSTRD